MDRSRGKQQTSFASGVSSAAGSSEFYVPEGENDGVGNPLLQGSAMNASSDITSPRLQSCTVGVLSTESLEQSKQANRQPYQFLIFGSCISSVIYIRLS